MESDGRLYFDRNVPGVMTREELSKSGALDNVRLSYKGTTVETRDRVFWVESDLDDASSIKSIVAELIAAVGPALGRQMVVAFS